MSAETATVDIAQDKATDKKDSDDGSGNTNGLVPPFRRLMRNYGIGLCVVSVAVLVTMITEAAMQWNERPSWIKKVPCVLQPQLSHIEVRSESRDVCPKSAGLRTLSAETVLTGSTWRSADKDCAIMAVRGHYLIATICRTPLGPSR